MNKELTKKLYDRFPDLYRQHSLPMQKTCMCWGFDHDDGWFNLVWMLSLALEDESKQSGVEIEAIQVKEKFGCLRFYVASYTDRSYDFISMAEEVSIKTCEVCGLLGRTCSKGGWLKTVCVRHARELNYVWETQEDSRMRRVKEGR